VLVEHFVRHFAHKTGKAVSGIEATIIDKLREQPLKGNVRELKNMLERAIIACEDDKLRLKHFCDLSPRATHGNFAASQAEPVLDLDILQKNAIIQALKQSGFNKTRAASLLNITWQALERRMKKFGL